MERMPNSIFSKIVTELTELDSAIAEIMKFIANSSNRIDRLKADSV